MTNKIPPVIGRVRPGVRCGHGNPAYFNLSVDLSKMIVQFWEDLDSKIQPRGSKCPEKSPSQ